MKFKIKTCGWIIQGLRQVIIHAGAGVADKEDSTDAARADYVLFVDGKPLGSVF